MYFIRGYDPFYRFVYVKTPAFTIEIGDTMAFVMQANASDLAPAKYSIAIETEQGKTIKELVIIR